VDCGNLDAQSVREMGSPLVSICVPTHNRAAALRESMKSICAQDYAPLDILISDNCSSDETEQVCREIAERDPRVRYVRQPYNIGLYGNHNFCIDEARGEFFGIFHDHDERSPQIVSRYVEFLRRHPDVGVVCSNWELIDDSGSVIGVRDYPVEEILPGLEFISQTIRSGRSAVGIPGALVRRAALGDIRFDEQCPIGFGDFIVWFRLAERASVGHLQDRLWRWRQQRQSQSARTIESLTRDYYENLTHYCDEHLTRWPAHGMLVAGWKNDIKRYLFWALAFELGLYFRHQAGMAQNRALTKTLFETLNYQLPPEAVARILQQMRQYKTGWVQTAAYGIIDLLIRIKVTQPLAWATYYHPSLRSLFGLK